MSWNSPISRKLYLRIWLAVAGSVLVLSLLVGWAWHAAEARREQERERLGPPPPREVVVRNAQGEVLGNAEAQVRRAPDRGLEFEVTMRDGEVLYLQMPPRNRGLEGGRRMGPPGGPTGGPPGAPPGGERRGGPPDRADRADGLLAWLRPPYGFVWMLALAGLAVMAALFPVARRLTRRLVSLQHGVQRWGEGDLSVRVPASGSDEVADLTRHFNTAADRIETLMGEQAALLASQKSLLANASHELRSPLARIRMALELMPSAGEPGALPARTRTELARNVAELDALVEEILLASRLEAREADLGSVEEVELLALLSEESARVGAAFEPDTGAGEVLVRGVPRLLRRAVRNLLENAVRYGRSATATAAAQAEPVLVRLVPAGRDVEIVVGDRGPGVPPAQRERIFEPFYRLPGASEREGGVGLGLALVRQIAERHGGSVLCRDREGGGAEFVLRLPRS